MTESRIRGELERKDPSGSGVVSEQALGKVLGKLGADLAGADLGRLMHRFDVYEVQHSKQADSIRANRVFCLLCGVLYPYTAPRERAADRSGSHVLSPPWELTKVAVGGGRGGYLGFVRGGAIVVFGGGETDSVAWFGWIAH